VGELREPLEPGVREPGLVEAVAGEVQVRQGGKVEERGVEAAGALQPAPAEVEGRHAAVGGGAGDALPAAAVGAGAPRRKGAGGFVGGVEGAAQPEQRRGLVRPARGICWRHGGFVGGVGELDAGKEQVNEQVRQELLVAGTGDHC